MKIMVNDAARHCFILIPRSEARDYRQSNAYHAAVSAYQSQGYAVGVFLGGEEPLLQSMTELLDRQERIGGIC